MTSPSQHFVRGDVYFVVTFADADLTVPIVQTLIFDQTGKRADGTAYLLFKQHQADGQDSKFLVDEKDVGEIILDKVGLMEKLKGAFEGKLPFTPAGG